MVKKILYLSSRKEEIGFQEELKFERTPSLEIEDNLERSQKEQLT